MLFRYRSVILTAGVFAVLSGNPLPTLAADAGQEALLREGSVEWNAMRKRKPPSMPVDLSGAKLKGRRLRKVDFSRANLAGADLSQSDLGGSDFRNADLHGASFDGSFLDGSRLQKAYLARADLGRIEAAEADFSCAKMPSVVLRRAELSNACFVGADLRGADLRESRLDYADFGKADLRAANFWLASVGGADFSGARISDETVLPTGKRGSAEWGAEHGAVFMPVAQSVTSVLAAAKPTAEKSQNTDANSVSSSLSQIANAPVVALSSQSEKSELAASPNTSPLAKTLKPLRAWHPDPTTVAYDGDQYEQLKSNVTDWNHLRESQPDMSVKLKEAPLANRRLAYADLHGADLEKVTFKCTDLEEADFRGANIKGADLRSANLEEADFRQADLRGANLWLANTSSTQFDGALVSVETVLDNGKKASQSWADEHGARFVDEP